MSETSAHDPGPETAGERGEAHATAAREPLTHRRRDESASGPRRGPIRR